MRIADDEIARRVDARHAHRRRAWRIRAVAQLTQIIRAPTPDRRVRVSADERTREGAVPAPIAVAFSIPATRIGELMPALGVVSGVPSCPCESSPQHATVRSARIAHA